MTFHGRCAGCWRRLCGLMVVLLVLAASACPQSGPTAASPAQDLSVETLAALRSVAEQDATLDATTKAAVLDLYDRAIEQARAAADWAAQAVQMDAATAAAPKQLADLHAALARPLGDVTPEIKLHTPLADLERLLAEEETGLTKAQNAVAQLEAEAGNRTARLTELPALQSRAKERLQRVQELLEGGPPGTDPAPVAKARRLAWQAEAAALEHEVSYLHKEAVHYQSTGDLLTARHDQAVRQVQWQERRVGVLRQLVSRARAQKAEEDASRARKAIQDATATHPLLGKLAQANAALALKRTGNATEAGLVQQIKQASAQLEDLRARVPAIQADFDSIQNRLKAVGITHVVGVFLRKQRDELPNLRVHRRNVSIRHARIADAQFTLLALRKERADLADIDAQVARMLATASPPVAATQEHELRGRVKTLLTEQRELLLNLIRDYDAYFRTLTELDAQERQLIDLVARYRAFINENIFWVRSTQSVWNTPLRFYGEAGMWLASSRGWLSVPQTLWLDAKANLQVCALLVLICAALLVSRRRLLAALVHLGERATSRSLADTFADTLAALVITVLLAANWPLLLWLLFWRLSASVDTPEFARAVAAGLSDTATILLTIRFFWFVCHPQGLGGAHFKWREETLTIVRRQLRWLAGFALPLTFLVAMLEWQSVQTHKDSLGRLLFLVGQIAFAIYIKRGLLPLTRLLEDRMSEALRAPMTRYSHVWGPLVICFPLFLFVLAWGGYYYTALQLYWRLTLTIWLVLGLLILHGFIRRWLFLARRTLALHEARRRRESTQAARAREEQIGDASPETLPVLDPGLDLHAINLQTRSLLRSALVLSLLFGLWVIWDDIVPAINYLERVQVWTTSLRNVLLTLFVAAVTVTMARNIPGLLEITVLQRLPIGIGERNAVMSIARYFIALAGFITAFNIFGVEWSSIQWLVAAMTVGLGFGLQEIFANFVSGIIILFERPVRVGDTVTVGGISGTVSSIRIRATTITDWDRKELIVPNREFITGQLINWTLSDPTIRLVLPVGFAYGSNVDLAHKVLLRVAQENPDVLSDPPPRAVFEKFGESSLDFTLRVYIAGIESMLRVRDALNTAIDAACREAGLEIAFPQRDIHIRSIDAPLPLPGRTTKDGDDAQ